MSGYRFGGGFGAGGGEAVVVAVGIVFFFFDEGQEFVGGGFFGQEEMVVVGGELESSDMSSRASEAAVSKPVDSGSLVVGGRGAFGSESDGPIGTDAYREGEQPVFLRGAQKTPRRLNGNDGRNKKRRKRRKRKEETTKRWDQASTPNPLARTTPHSSGRKRQKTRPWVTTAL